MTSAAPSSTSWCDFSFERIFTEKYDFYATLFEYLIKDYNKDSGGKYAEYYTPHAVAKIMAAILVPEPVRGKVKNVSCYDPSAGSGTLLMNLAHAIGEQRCSIYSQDISQKSSSLLRLNLILNNLVHSIPNIIQGNTMLHPYHRDGKALQEIRLHRLQSAVQDGFQRFPQRTGHQGTPGALLCRDAQHPEARP